MNEPLWQTPSSALPSALVRPRTPFDRGRLALLLTLSLLTIGTWALTVYQARHLDMPMGIAARAAATGGTMDGMSGMAMAGATGTGWSASGALTFVGVWTVMMAAMMLPAAIPMLLLFGTVHAGRRAGSGVFVPTWVFAAGYLLVWGAVGVATYVVVQFGSNLATRVDAGNRATWAPLALGATLGLAGLYQLTPPKRTCLDRCRSPFGFVLMHWREGRAGALRMGIDHGASCLGCCWALSAVLVAAGMMSLAWMVLLTLAVFAEKVIPHGQGTAAGVGVAFIVLGILVAAGASGMPWDAS
jgi:predicted metal-binding membrane protein